MLVIAGRHLPMLRLVTTMDTALYLPTCITSLLYAGDKNLMTPRPIASMQNYAATQTSHTAAVIKKVGVPIGQSLLAYEQGDYDTALDLMMTHRIFTPQLGASNAQRDLLALFGIDMAHRANASALQAQLVQEREFARQLARP